MLIQKGGLFEKDLKGSPDNFYKTQQKEFTMRKVDKSVTKFIGQAGKTFHNSIYKQEELFDA